MNLRTPPVAKAQMLIRKPAAEVFEAFANPAITAKFWFTKSSGRLEQGKEVQWSWEMYGFSIPVKVNALEPNRHILIEWGHPPCPVEWNFTARPDGTTFVTVANWGFGGSDEEKVRAAIDSTGGFNLVLAACKAYLEHGVQLNIVADHNPDAHVKK